MKRNQLFTLLASLALLLTQLDVIAMKGEKESKRRASKKEASTIEKIPLTITALDRAQFQLKKKKVGPFDFKGIMPIDSGSVLAIKKNDFSNIAVGIVHHEKQDDNQLFALKFDKDWQNPEMLFQYPLKGFKTGSGVVGIYDNSIIVIGIGADNMSIPISHLNFAGEEVETPFGLEIDTMPLKGEVAGVDKITGITFKKEKKSKEQSEKEWWVKPRITVHVTYTLTDGKTDAHDFTFTEQNPEGWA